MKKLVSLTKEGCTHKKLKLRIREFKITYSNFFYNISIVPNNENSLNLFFAWKVGVLGEYIFKQQYENMINISNHLRKILISNGYTVNTLSLINHT